MTANWRVLNGSGDISGSPAENAGSCLLGRVRVGAQLCSCKQVAGQPSWWAALIDGIVCWWAQIESRGKSRRGIELAWSLPGCACCWAQLAPLARRRIGSNGKSAEPTLDGHACGNVLAGRAAPPTRRFQRNRCAAELAACGARGLRSLDRFAFTSGQSWSLSSGGKTERVREWEQQVCQTKPIQ